MDTFTSLLSLPVSASRRPVRTAPHRAGPSDVVGVSQTTVSGGQQTTHQRYTTHEEMPRASRNRRTLRADAALCRSTAAADLAVRWQMSPRLLRKTIILAASLLFIAGCVRILVLMDPFMSIRGLQESDYGVLLPLKYRLEGARSLAAAAHSGCADAGISKDEVYLSFVREQVAEAQRLLDWEFRPDLLEKISLEDVASSVASGSSEASSRWGRIRGVATLANLIWLFAIAILLFAAVFFTAVFAAPLLLRFGKEFVQIVLWTPAVLESTAYAGLYALVRYAFANFERSIAAYIALPSFVLAPLLVIGFGILRGIRSSSDQAQRMARIIDYACLCFLVGGLLFQSQVYGVLVVGLFFCRLGFFAFSFPGSSSFVFGFSGEAALYRCTAAGLLLTVVSTAQMYAVRPVAIARLEFVSSGLLFFGPFCGLLGLLILSSSFRQQTVLQRSVANIFFAVTSGLLMYAGLASRHHEKLSSLSTVAGIFLVLWSMSKIGELPMGRSALAFWLRLMLLAAILYAVSFVLRICPELLA